jgi:hypothetical protein
LVSKFRRRSALPVPDHIIVAVQYAGLRTLSTTS